MQAELVEAGTERARSLGWTDVYTFTKALGERVVADVGAEHRGLDRPAGDRRVVLAAPVPGLDRGLQDGRAADPGVRPGRAAGVPGLAGLGRRHRALRPRGQRDPRGLCDRAGDRRAGVLPRQLRRPEPADLQRAVRPHPRLLLRAPVRRWASAARPGCRSGSSRGRRRWSGCCRPRSGRTSSPTGPSPRPPGPTGPASSPRTSTGPGAGSTSCAATSSSTTSTRSPSCTSSTTTRFALTNVAAPRRPGQLRVRHGGLRLDDLHRGRALPLDHRARSAGWTRSGASAATGRAR